MDSKQFQMTFLVVVGLIGLIGFIALVGNPFTNEYQIKHQCDAEPYGYGDPNCYNYKDHFGGNWYPFEISKGIAERSGGDMERFCDYHKQFGKECEEKKAVEE